MSLVIKKKNYNESVRKYLQSKKWKKKRQEAIELYKTCVLCDGNKNFHVHHRKYSNVGGEDIHTDVILLCEECHNDLVKLFKRRSQKTGAFDLSHDTDWNEVLTFIDG